MHFFPVHCKTLLLPDSRKLPFQSISANHFFCISFFLYFCTFLFRFIVRPSLPGCCISPPSGFEAVRDSHKSQEFFAQSLSFTLSCSGLFLVLIFYLPPFLLSCFTLPLCSSICAYPQYFPQKSFGFGRSHFRYHPFSWINIQNFIFISSFHHFFQKTFVMRLTSSRNSLWRRVNNKSKVTVSKNERMKAFQCKLKRSEVESTSFVFHQIRGRIFAQSLKRICTLRPPTHLARSEQQRSIEDI